MHQVQHDEIDLFDLFKTLWQGKLLISATAALAFLLSIGFIALKDPEFESKLIYSIDTIPPFYDQNRAKTDFKKKFFSLSVFKDWKQNNTNTSITFEDFSVTQEINGYVLSKDKREQFVELGSEKKVWFVLVKSNQLPVLDEFFRYALHINAILKKEYIQRAKEELNIIETRFKDFSTANDSIIANILSIDRYVATAENGAEVYSIQPPTMPLKVSPKTSLILSISSVMGGLIGVMYLLILSAIRKRKEQLVKT